MERPSRKTKAVNYSLDFDDDDEDFAFVKAPPSKKARDSVKNLERVNSKKSSTNSSSQESETQSLVHKNRVPVDDKVFARDLEAAVTLSMLQTAELKEEQYSNNNDVKIQPQINCVNAEPAQRLTNCSVDINLLGLNQITSEQSSPCAPSRQRKGASRAASKATEQHSSTLEDEDEDYQPKGTPDSESDDDFSDQSESGGEEEFTVKKKKTTNKEATKRENTERPPVCKKEKQPKPTAKQQLTANPTVLRSPVVAKPAPVQRRPPSTPPVSRPAVSVTPSPAGGRIPKWNPPAQIGRSPGTSQSASVKSPGQGLRLGLSRRVRVKPLHPSVAIH